MACSASSLRQKNTFFKPFVCLDLALERWQSRVSIVWQFRGQHCVAVQGSALCGSSEEKLSIQLLWLYLSVKAWGGGGGGGGGTSDDVNRDADCAGTH